MRKLLIFSVMLCLLVLAGCSQSISEVKSEEYIGKQVSVRGTVESTLKIGTLSGYVIRDEEGNTISVSSDNLPEEGKTKTAKGTLMRDTIFGYYIQE